MPTKKKRGRPPSKLALRKVSIRLYVVDIEKAKERAEHLAMDHQTYIRMLLHKALTAREEATLK